MSDDTTALIAFMQTLTPDQHAMLTPFMRNPEPLPEDDGWVQHCPPALLEQCLALGILRRVQHSSIDPPGILYATYWGLEPTVSGYLAWKSWNRSASKLLHQPLYGLSS